MALLAQGLPWIQIVLAILLTGLILLQRSGAELGGAFGGGDGSGGATYTRRGAERIIFFATIIIATLFVVASLAALFIARG